MRRLLHAAKRPDAFIALYLEDLRDLPPAGARPLARYGRLAYRLGMAQNAMRGHPILSEPWLSPGWLRSYLAEREEDFFVLEHAAPFADGTVRHFLPTGVRPAAAAKYAWIGPALPRSLEQNLPTTNRRPVEEAVPVRTGLVRFILAVAPQAHDLARHAQ